MHNKRMATPIPALDKQSQATAVKEMQRQRRFGFVQQDNSEQVINWFNGKVKLFLILASVVFAYAVL